jgi:8-oxo-dGTP pyrophosphatase MutT (NUDIX family)
MPPAAYQWMKMRAAKGLRFGVAARVENARRQVLLVRLNPESAWTRKWITPGGGAEPGESPRSAILREIHEETGVRVGNLQLWKVYHESLKTERDEGVSWDFLQFTAIWIGGRPRSRVPHEISEVRWFRGLPRNMEFRDDWVCPPRGRFGTH